MRPAWEEVPQATTTTRRQLRRKASASAPRAPRAWAPGGAGGVGGAAGDDDPAPAATQEIVVDRAEIAEVDAIRARGAVGDRLRDGLRLAAALPGPAGLGAR